MTVGSEALMVLVNFMVTVTDSSVAGFFTTKFFNNCQLSLWLLAIGTKLLANES